MSKTVSWPGSPEWVQAQMANKIADWLQHIDRLDEIPGARIPLPTYNPLWDAAEAIREKFGSER